MPARRSASTRRDRIQKSILTIVRGPWNDDKERLQVRGL